MVYNNIRMANTRPYSFSEFLSSLLLFENPIKIEKLNDLLLEYNDKFERRAQGVNTENLSFPTEYIELFNGEYKLVNGITLETEVTEGMSLFKFLFLQTKPIIYDFFHEKYLGKQSKKTSPYGNVMRDIKQSDTNRQKPVLNDSLYRNCEGKEEIDLIRLAFYEVFGKDLKVIGSTYQRYDDSYLHLVQNHYKFVPLSNISGPLGNSSGIWIGFSESRFNNERYTSFSYEDIFMADQGFSEDYIKFCQLANRQISGGDLNLVERNLRTSINICHIEYRLRNMYSGPQQSEFADMPFWSLNRFVQYLASRTRYGDSQLGYIHYFDKELLKQVLTEQEYRIVIKFMEEYNADYQKFYEQRNNIDLPNIEVGTSISYIRKKQ